MDEQGSISITQALNQIQSWLNANEYDKAIQGCTEILELEPGNQRALALLKIAEERRHKVMTTPPPAPVSTKPDPLADLQVETSAKPNPFERPAFSESADKRQLFLAMLIPAVIVVLLGGSLIWFLANRERSDTIAKNSGSNVTEAIDKDYLEDNETRVKEMTQMAKVIDDYRREEGQYPSVEDIEKVIVQSEEYSKIPKDPKQGEMDAEGKAYGYMYAVYDSKFGKENQYYVLSALFEDSKGVGYEWNVGENTKNYSDYRDISKDNVTFIGGND